MIKDFLSGGEDGGIAAITGKITLIGLLDSMGSLNEDNAFTRALLYGKEGRDYQINEAGEIEFLPLVYEYSEEADEFTAPDGTVVYESRRGMDGRKRK